MSVADCIKRKREKVSEPMSKKARMEIPDDVIPAPPPPVHVQSDRFEGRLARKPFVRFSECPPPATGVGLEEREGAFAKKRGEAVTPGGKKRAIKKGVVKQKSKAVAQVEKVDFDFVRFL